MLEISLDKIGDENFVMDRLQIINEESTKIDTKVYKENYEGPDIESTGKASSEWFKGARLYPELIRLDCGFWHNKDKICVVWKMIISESWMDNTDIDLEFGVADFDAR